MKSYFKPKANKIIYLIFFIIFFLKTNSYSEEITGYAKVIDGDTIRIKGNKIRLYGIDALKTIKYVLSLGWAWT